MRVVYTPAPGDSLSVEVFGLEFFAGEPVDVAGAVAEKLASNPTFRATPGDIHDAPVVAGAGGDDTKPAPVKKPDGRSREARQAKEAAEMAARERAAEIEVDDGDDENAA